MAIMNVGRSSNPEQRITEAINQALNSPLVNTTDVHGASRILLNFYCSTDNAIRMQELDQINRFIEQVGDEVRVTVIATGYSVSNIPGIEDGQDEPRIVTPEVQVKISIDDAIKGFYNEPEEKTNSDKPSENSDQNQEQQPSEEPEDEPELVTEGEKDSQTETHAEEQHTDTDEPEAEQEKRIDDAQTASNSYFDFDLDDETEQQLDSQPAWMRH